MILLVSGATLSGRRYLGHPDFGWLKTPANGNAISTILESGVPFWIYDLRFTIYDCYLAS